MALLQNEKTTLRSEMRPLRLQMNSLTTQIESAPQTTRTERNTYNALVSNFETITAIISSTERIMQMIDDLNDTNKDKTVIGTSAEAEKTNLNNLYVENLKKLERQDIATEYSKLSNPNKKTLHIIRTDLNDPVLNDKVPGLLVKLQALGDKSSSDGFNFSGGNSISAMNFLQQLLGF
ncbi:hypothetical protein QKU48_gp0837 [Fadolivirus algeromassiliense]|jgi:chromosome segregation ATPase|uniref:Uncharacterized protein n=1 Tax=Fadolivirus FV1/VV64 TaxID=3070911 RepID=A0A7D3V5N6_9VIRU|nr:hypothetical protein QKU48_gp0837 [Fadolivirus algeromassiliense]QKF94295.1 hypothetical protein Fadolivirus_1_837 [Fadolivirus FV1/VV64]